MGRGSLLSLWVPLTGHTRASVSPPARGTHDPVTGSWGCNLGSGRESRSEDTASTASPVCSIPKSSPELWEVQGGFWWISAHPTLWELEGVGTGTGNATACAGLECQCHCEGHGPVSNAGDPCLVAPGDHRLQGQTPNTGSDVQRCPEETLRLCTGQNLCSAPTYTACAGISPVPQKLQSFSLAGKCPGSPGLWECPCPWEAPQIPSAQAACRIPLPLPPFHAWDALRSLH